MSDVITALFERIPATATNEQRNMIQAAFGVTKQLATGIDAIAKRDDLTPKGRADLIQKEARAAGTAFQKSREQYERHAGTIENMRIAMHKKAIGEPKDTDAERRTMLRAMSLNERISKVNSDPLARAAALREPGLSEIGSDLIEKLTEIAVKENAPTEAQQIAEFEEAQVIHKAALEVAERKLLETPFLVDDNGNPRRPQTMADLSKFLSAES
jgi:hypothetical protein